MKNNTEDLFNGYAGVIRQIKKLESKKKKLADQVMAKMVECNLGKVDGQAYLVTRCTKTSWEYTKAVDTFKEHLQKVKKAEEETGVAKKKETEFLKLTLR